MFRMLMLIILLVFAGVVSAQAGVYETSLSRQGGNDKISKVDDYIQRVLDKRAELADYFRLHELNESVNIAVKRRSEISPIRTFSIDSVWQNADGKMIRTPQSINGVELSTEAQSFFQRGLDHLHADDESPFYVFHLRWLLFQDFQDGSFYFSREETVNGTKVMVIEFYPSQIDDFRRVVFYISAEDDHIVECLVEMDELRFDTLGVQNSLPVFASSILKFFLFEDITYSLKMQSFEGGWVPESISIQGTKRRIDGDLLIEYEKKFTNYKKSS